MDCRKRVDPPMRETYFGNLIQAIFSPCSRVVGGSPATIRGHGCKLRSTTAIAPVILLLWWWPQPASGRNDYTVTVATYIVTPAIAVNATQSHPQPQPQPQPQFATLFGASLIQKAIEAHNSEAIDVRNKEWESAPKIFKFKDAGVNCVAVGSLPRFKVYDVDFGWGKPENVRSGTNNKFDGMVYLYAGISGGRSIDVELTLEPEAMGRLEKDKEFLMEV